MKGLLCMAAVALGDFCFSEPGGMQARVALNGNSIKVVASAQDGWVGIGIPQSANFTKMSKGNFVVGGGGVVYDRALSLDANGRPDKDATNVMPGTGATSTNGPTTTLSFSRLLAPNGLNRIDPSKPFRLLWAHGNVTNPNAVGFNKIDYHGPNKGSFVVDLVHGNCLLAPTGIATNATNETALMNQSSTPAGVFTAATWKAINSSSSNSSSSSSNMTNSSSSSSSSNMTNSTSGGSNNQTNSSSGSWLGGGSSSSQSSSSNSSQNSSSSNGSSSQQNSSQTVSMFSGALVGSSSNSTSNSTNGSGSNSTFNSTSVARTIANGYYPDDNTTIATKSNSSTTTTQQAGSNQQQTVTTTTSTSSTILKGKKAKAACIAQGKVICTKQLQQRGNNCVLNTCIPKPGKS